MNIDYYNNLLGKLRDSFVQCPRNEPYKIKVELTKHQIEDLFILWKDQAYKKWGLKYSTFGNIKDVMDYSRQHSHNLIIVDEAGGQNFSRDRYRREIARLFKVFNKDPWGDNSKGKPESEFKECVPGDFNDCDYCTSFSCEGKK